MSEVNKAPRKTTKAENSAADHIQLQNTRHANLVAVYNNFIDERVKQEGGRLKATDLPPIHWVQLFAEKIGFGYLFLNKLLTQKEEINDVSARMLEQRFNVLDGGLDCPGHIAQGHEAKHAAEREVVQGILEEFRQAEHGILVIDATVEDSVVIDKFAAALRKDKAAALTALFALLEAIGN